MGRNVNLRQVWRRPWGVCLDKRDMGEDGMFVVDKRNEVGLRFAA